MVNHRLYNEQDIEEMLFRLSKMNIWEKSDMLGYVEHIDNTLGDRTALINIISDPLEYNIDYMYHFDSDVIEQFIRIMEMFGVAY